MKKYQEQFGHFISENLPILLIGLISIIILLGAYFDSKYIERLTNKCEEQFGKDYFYRDIHNRSSGFFCVSNESDQIKYLRR